MSATEPKFGKNKIRKLMAVMVAVSLICMIVYFTEKGLTQFVEILLIAFIASFSTIIAFMFDKD